MQNEKTVKDIALELGVTPETVRGWAHKAGFETPRGRGKVASFGKAEVASIIAQRGK